MATEQQIADWTERRRINAGLPRIHFEVWYPHPNFDFSSFCCDCYPDAVECAKQFVEEAMDGLEVNELGSVTIKCFSGDPEQCFGAVCVHMRKEGNDGN